MTDLRMAIISATGTARKRLIPAVRARKLCSIVAVHGRDCGKLAALASEHSIPQFFLDAEKMLDETKPDFVFIGSPPPLHREQIQMCIERDIPVLCEKPLCLTSVEAQALRSLMTSRQTPLRIAHHLRHQRGIAVVRDLIARGSYGRLCRVAMQWGFWLNEAAGNATWKLDPNTGGPNCFYDAGVHAIDMMLHLLPAPTKVTAIAQRSRFPLAVDNISASILCENVIVELSASQSLKCPVNALTFDFEQATIHVPHAMSEKSFGKMQILSPSEATVEEFEEASLYANEVEDFIRLLKGEVSLGTTLEEACEAIRVLEAITKSYSKGRTINLR